MKNYKKILITGSNGFVGNHLKNELKKKYNVFGLGRKIINEKNYLRIDLNNKKEISNLFCKYKFDMVIHCAWYTNHSNYRKSKINYKYLRLSKYLLDQYIKNGGRNFIGIGTCEEYEKNEKKKNLFYEKSNVRPVNVYAKTKNMFHQYLRKKRINYKWIRLFYIFGENENKERLLPTLIKNSKIKSNFKLKYPFFKTDFIYVKTLCKMISKLINKKTSGDFNVCSGKSIMLLHLLNLTRLFFYKQPIRITNHQKKKLDFEEIVGSVKKLKKFKSFIYFNIKNDLKKYLKLYKNTSP